MERRLAGMIGAAVLATVGATQIAAAAPDPQDVLQARSFAELLQPIPDATVLLAAAEAASARDLTTAAGSEGMDRRMLAQYHHHHHHHHHWRRYHHHPSLPPSPSSTIITDVSAAGSARPFSFRRAGHLVFFLCLLRLGRAQHETIGAIEHGLRARNPA